MPAPRKLQLPDGGTLDLPIPEEFGAPIFDAPDTLVENLRMILAGAIAGGLIVAFALYIGKKL